MARKKHPYTVVPVKYGDFLDLKKLKSQSYKNLKIGVKGKGLTG